MRYKVLITPGAERDLEEITDHIAEHDSPPKTDHADHVLNRPVEVIDGLSNSPERGSFAKELLSVGIKDFRQVFFKPYRIVYRVIESTLYVLVVADGRRDMQALLMRRLLRD